jgi:hypothetical protein
MVFCWKEVISMELEIFWGVVTLIGIFLSNKFKSSFKQFMGPMLIGFTGCLWVAYILG